MLDYRRVPIAGYEGHYEVDNFGNIFSIKTNRKLLKLDKNEAGYLQINLTDGHTHKWHKVHRLVAFAFVEGYDESTGRTTVNHIDGNKENNKISNLEWSNMSEQRQHAIKTGLMKVRFTDDDIRFIRSYDGASKDLAEKFNVNVNNIYRIRKGLMYSNVGDSNE